MINPKTPILVSGAQFTQRTVKEGRITESLSPIDMLEKVALAAIAQSGAGKKLISALDTIAVVRSTADTPGDQGRLTKRVFRNPPGALARRLHAEPRRALYTAAGGNTPQWLVNRTAEEIARGECKAVLLCGAEYVATMIGAVKQGVDLGWQNSPDADTGDDPIEIGDLRDGVNAYERRYGLQFPVNAYPLFENALRGARGRDPAAHLKWLGEFFSPFSRIAAANEYSWFPTYRSPEEISTPSARNRFVGFPYTKYLNAVIEVDMAAAVVMTSVEAAHELGIPESNWVYLHGCADAHDIWNVTERVNYHSSPAIHMMGQKALAMANRSIADISCIDLYSCFPSAVQIGCQELGIALDDPRELTVTGGLPYFGGPGNNYVMHSIVTMTDRLRANPGKFGLCTGNGWYVTKHSAGIYSTTPREGVWEREDPKTYQKELDAMAHPRVTETPQGPATIETYTVVTDRKGRRFGLVVGRDQNDARFLANTLDRDAVLDWMMKEEMLGRKGMVGAEGARNIFRFD